MYVNWLINAAEMLIMANDLNGTVQQVPVGACLLRWCRKNLVGPTTPSCSVLEAQCLLE